LTIRTHGALDLAQLLTQLEHAVEKSSEQVRGDSTSVVTV
jgi:hypothetical protein